MKALAGSSLVLASALLAASQLHCLCVEGVLLPIIIYVHAADIMPSPLFLSSTAHLLWRLTVLCGPLCLYLHTHDSATHALLFQVAMIIVSSHASGSWHMLGIMMSLQHPPLPHQPSQDMDCTVASNMVFMREREPHLVKLGPPLMQWRLCGQVCIPRTHVSSRGGRQVHAILLGLARAQESRIHSVVLSSLQKDTAWLYQTGTARSH